MAGLAMASACLGGFWALATASLLMQEEGGAWQHLRAVTRDWRALRASGRPGVSAVFIRGIREYVRPDFHPSQSDTDRLAEAYLAAAGLA
jgi:predicted metal-dependent hydrolase